MATTDTPESPLDRVARDLSRTLWHGSRPTDNDGNVKPSTIATGQQIRVDVPASDDLNFVFTAGGSTLQVTTPNAQATATDGFMNEALGTKAKAYLSLDVDKDIPTWVFQQRQFSIMNPPAADDIVSAPPFTAVKLPSAALQQVQDTGGGSYVSLWTMNPANVIPRSSWQPAIVLRFPLRPATASLADGTKVYELVGTPEGDRWYLDQLGLLPLGPTVAEQPAIQSISFYLEKPGPSNKPIPSPLVTTWSIARANLTREARASQLMDLTADAVVAAPVFPYIVVSGDTGQNEDAVRLLEMASITNSGGYFLGAVTDWVDATTLVLTVILDEKADSDTSQSESAWLPLAANAVALTGTTPDVVRFNGLSQIEVAPYTPPGTVSFGWTRTVLPNSTDPEDQFAYGTLSIVDYSATDGAGQAVPLAGAIPVISPLDSLPGDHYTELAPTAPQALQDATLSKSAAIRVGSPPVVRSALADAAPADPAATAVHYYRASLCCYDKATESPWKRLSDSNARNITLKPGFRDVFGNRFDPYQGPAITRRIFYTDAVVSPSEWPGVRFAIYPGISGGSPCLSLEMSYSAAGSNDSRKQRLTDICYQLQGVDNDVAVTFTAVPLVNTDSAATLDNNAIITQLKAWANGDTSNLVLVLKTVTCAGSVNVPKKLDPRVTVTRTKADYLPLPTDLPENTTLNTLIAQQVKTVSAPALLQSDATPPPATAQDDKFQDVAAQFQKVLADPLQLQVGFLRDQDNIHELWLIPNSVFPGVSADPAVSSKWSVATPCPLSSVLGSDSFQNPDFTTSTSAGSNWQNFPLKQQAVVDQDYDQLGRVALRMIEGQTANLNTLMLRGNAATMRGLLQTREAIANQLAIYQNNGFLVPLFADEASGDIDGAAVSRAAKDAFLSDLNAFYSVSTILQLPLETPGSVTIQTFQGVVAPTWAGTAPTPAPTFSDVLLGGGDKKVTILYDLPAGVILADSIPAIYTLQVSITHVQMPLPGAPLGASPFNEGPWIQLATPKPGYPLVWKGYSEYIPVAERIFPTKPVIQSTKALMPWMDPVSGAISPPAKIDATSAGLLARWGWEFSLGLVNAVTTDTVHITVNYPLPVLPTSGPAAFALAAGWSPVSLLHSLFVLKLLNDNWNGPAVATTQLPVLLQLAGYFSGFLAQGPPMNNSASSILSAGTAVSDLFTLGLHATAPTAVATAVMKNLPSVQWTPPKNGVDIATLVAPAEAPGNTACLTGPNAVRSFKISLTLLRNETFGKASPRPGNKLLVYQCAPTESPIACQPLNQWIPTAGTDALQFDMAGYATLQAAFQAFFDGILHTSDLSQLSLEAGLSLAWTKGSMKASTPFSILPSDLPPPGSVGTTSLPAAAGFAVAAFLFDRCQELLPKNAAGALIPPPEVDSASIRLRVKLTAADPDTPSGRRTLVEVIAIDFPLTS